MVIKIKKLNALEQVNNLYRYDKIGFQEWKRRVLAIEKDSLKFQLWVGSLGHS